MQSENNFLESFLHPENKTVLESCFPVDESKITSILDFFTLEKIFTKQPSNEKLFLKYGSAFIKKKRPKKDKNQPIKPCFRVKKRFR